MRNDLLHKYGEDGPETNLEKKARVPTVEKIRAAKAELKKLGAFEINNNAELTEWAHTRRCSSADELDAVVDFDRLLVLNTFYRNITIEVEEIDGVDPRSGGDFCLI